MEKKKKTTKKTFYKFFQGTEHESITRKTGRKRQNEENQSENIERAINYKIVIIIFTI